MNFKEAIEILKNNGITAYEIASKTNLTEVGINKIFSGKTKKPHKSTQETIIKYAKSLANTKLYSSKSDLDLASKINKEGIKFDSLDELVMFISKKHQLLSTFELYKQFISSIKKQGVIEYYEDRGLSEK